MFVKNHPGKNKTRNGKKSQSCQFNLKFGIKINSNMQKSMVMFTFSVFDLIKRQLLLLAMFSQYIKRLWSCITASLVTSVLPPDHGDYYGMHIKS